LLPANSTVHEVSLVADNGQGLEAPSTQYRQARGFRLPADGLRRSTERLDTRISCASPNAGSNVYREGPHNEGPCRTSKC
jgi:hypothetical protein